MTVDEFDDFLLKEKPAEKVLEYIGGRMVHSLSSNSISIIGAFLSTKICYFVLQRQCGYVTAANSGYRISVERYVPAVAYTAKENWHIYPVQFRFSPHRPDLAVEVISPFDSALDLRVKVVHYPLAGTTLLLVDPERKSIEMYIPGQKPCVLMMRDTLDGGQLLPGFSLPVSEIFKDD